VGGVPLGRATDPYGRVAEYPGMYVVDSALIPRGLAGNPALTVTALAERNIERIVREDFGA
jgi:cholesterol oxidase